jgi:catechol 2,3-dioxygenase-like lactoylglutathione lyase family enzyme
MMATTELEPHKQIIATKGKAVGKITGINHIVLVCKDMEKSVRFYRDVLGLKLVLTQPTPRIEYERQYFFELGNGELLSLYQVGNVVDAKEEPIVPKMWPATGLAPSMHPQKMDHLAFEVETNDEVEWFWAYLQEQGVTVSKIAEREFGKHALCNSFYFYDPDDNPLEIATSVRNDSRWDVVDRTVWLREKDPVPSAVDPS